MSEKNISVPAVAAPLVQDQPPPTATAADPMTLCERLRNPAWVNPFIPVVLPIGQTVTLKVGTPTLILHTDRTRDDMREAANRIEALEAALKVRNAEVVDALKWLKGAEPPKAGQ